MICDVKDDSVICTGAQPEKTGLNVLICDIGNPLAANKRVSGSSRIT